MIDQIDNLPEIGFIDGKTLDEVKEEMAADYEAKYLEVTGTSASLMPGEPVKLILDACAVQIYQQYLLLEKAARMNFLKYSYGDYLDNLAAWKGISRQGAKSASCTVRFTLSAIRPEVIAIPQGTRVTQAGTGAYFATSEYGEVPVGSLYVDVPCTAMAGGVAGNGYPAGSLTSLVDYVPYVQGCSNITETAGGLDGEDDEALKERLYLSPSNFSTAGPETAYEFFVKEAYPDVGDVRVSSPSECEVDIRVIGRDGQPLSSEAIAAIQSYLDDGEIRPLTDHVVVSAPDETTYDVAFTYWINRSDYAVAGSIQAAVQAAVQSYTEWQSSRIGRDVNPSKLVELVMAAGAKRVAVTSPSHQVIGGDVIAMSGTTTVTYGGLEDD